MLQRSGGMSAFVLCAAVTTASAVVSLGFSLAAVAQTSDRARLNALYAASRSLALLVWSVAATVLGSFSLLIGAAVAMTIAQALDALIGVIQRNTPKMLGPAAFAAGNLIALLATATALR